MPIYEYKCDVCGRVFDKYCCDQIDVLIIQKCPEPSCNGIGSKIYSSFSIGKAYEEKIPPVSQDEKIAVLIVDIIKTD